MDNHHNHHHHSLYRDYCRETNDELLESILRETRGTNDSKEYFPVKVHNMLSKVEHQGLTNIVSWQPHGRCFRIHNEEEFENQILPTLFRASKIISFKRQLKNYAFRRVKKGKDKGGYYHEQFLRGEVFLCLRIKRVVNPETMSESCRRKSEPDFYNMEFLPTIKSADNDDNNNKKNNEKNELIGDVGSRDCFWGNYENSSIKTHGSTSNCDAQIMNEEKQVQKSKIIEYSATTMIHDNKVELNSYYPAEAHHCHQRDQQPDRGMAILRGEETPELDTYTAIRAWALHSLEQQKLAEQLAESKLTILGEGGCHTSLLSTYHPPPADYD